MRVGFWLLISASLLGSSARGPAFADPGPIGDYLMNQKVSIFSFGMLRLNMELQRLQEQLGGGGFMSPHYDWDKNRIKIVGVFEEQALTKEQCKYFIGYIKSRAGINPDTGKLVLGDGSMYASLFSDIGFELKSKPENIDARLDEIITVQVNLLEFDNIANGIRQKPAAIVRVRSAFHTDHIFRLGYYPDWAHSCVRFDCTLHGLLDQES